MLDRVLSTPRPVPSKLLPALGASLVLALALPIFVVAGWSVAGWALGALLWVAVRALGLLLDKAKGTGESGAATGLQAFGMMFKPLVVLVVLVALASSKPHTALAAAVVFGLAYTAELALSLYAYFGAPSK